MMFENALNVRYLYSLLLGTQNQGAKLDFIFFVEVSIKWFFFNIVLALLPLLFNLIIIKIGSIKTNWFQLLKDGELFFFSSTIAASSIGNLLFKNFTNTIFVSLVLYFLMIILMISTGMFALSSFLKLKQMDVIDKKIFSTISAWCAIITIFASYVAFALGGMK